VDVSAGDVPAGGAAQIVVDEATFVLPLEGVIDIAADRFAGFASTPKVATGTRDDILVVQSSHGNSNQFYQSTSLITLVRGELSLVDTILTLSDLYCGVERDQSVTVLAAKMSSGRKWPLEVVVTDELIHTGEPCGDTPLPEPFALTYSTRYAWSASLGLYVRPDDAWNKLDEVNGERY
jgi:hypothetical protein